jgi:small subunit ribosomal protein S4
LLTRRLQTLVFKKFGFKTPYQARQAVVHGHIMIGDRIVNIPSYTVTTSEEDNIKFTPESKFPEMLEKSKETPVEAPVESEEASEQEASATEAPPAQAPESKAEKSSAE